MYEEKSFEFIDLLLIEWIIIVVVRSIQVYQPSRIVIKQGQINCSIIVSTNNCKTQSSTLDCVINKNWSFNNFISVVLYIGLMLTNDVSQCHFYHRPNENANNKLVRWCWSNILSPRSHAYAILSTKQRVGPKLGWHVFRNIAIFTSLDNVDAPSLVFLLSVIHYHCPDIWFLHHEAAVMPLGRAVYYQFSPCIFKWTLH